MRESKLKAGEWIETEVQGRGRRYWFSSPRIAAQFAIDRHKRGTRRVVYDGGGSVTVWVSFSKARTTESDMQRAGIDTADLSAR